MSEGGSGIGDRGSAENTEVLSLGGGRYQVVTPAGRRVAYAVSSDDAMWVFLEGRTYVVQDQPNSPRRTTRSDDDVALAAPMPATVVAVNVAPGQPVKRGDVLVTLEAMKMELAVRAPRDGTVRSVACRQGELVQPGIPLLELE